MSVHRILTNICSDQLIESRDFYVALLGLKVNFDSDWYIQLSVPEHPEIEFGIIRRDHDLVPPEYQKPVTGMYVTFVVEDVEKIYQLACTMGLKIIQEPRNEFYGQRRFLVADPNGCLVDICSPWKNGE